MCQSDDDCDSVGGATCAHISGAGVCVYPRSSNSDVLVLDAPAAPHYEKPPCQDDEVQASLKDADGSLCAPRCDASGSCPSDVPDGVTAAPQCALRDQGGNKYCALMCQSDDDCDSTGGAKCAHPRAGV